MGIPVRSIKSFEENIKYHSRKDWTLVLIVNANSDSRAVEFIHHNFHIMDTLSNDVDFYMPGYRKRIGLSERLMMQESWYLNMEQAEFSDSHLQSLNARTIYSRRLGSIAFCEAEFVDCVLEFTSKVPGYAYLGFCQMILVPIKDRVPDYKTAQVYDLDKIIDTPSGPSLDYFFHYAFQCIRESRNNSFMQRLLGRHSSVINQITRLYHEATTNHFVDDKYKIVIRNVILDMEKCLQWSLQEEYYFISYSSKNVMKAFYLKSLMQEMGLNVWIAPDGIPLGRDYSLVVPMALRFAKNFVLILSKESARSRWVKRELDIAISNEANTKVRVLLTDGFTIDDIRNDDELFFYLNKIQIKFQYDDVTNNWEQLSRFVTG